jgi:hypothetical protein
VGAIDQPKTRDVERSLGRKAQIRSRDLERSRPFRWLVRTGFVARGITYGLVGALAVALAAGAGTMGTSASQQGALSLIARGWLGRIALVVISAGLLAYALWKIAQGLLGHGPEGGGSRNAFARAGNIASGIAYLVFFAVAVRILVGGGGGASGGPQHEAAGVLGWPGGPVLVGPAGGALIAGSAYFVYYALSGHFAREAKTGEMDSRQRGLFLGSGRIGLSARALVFALIGYFLIRTAFDFNAKSAVGVDGALSRLHHQAFGPWLVGLVAVGLLLFAAFSLLEARFRRL